MKYTTSESDEAVTLEPAAAARGCVVWLHGLGADGYDFVPLVPELPLPAEAAVRFVFPHAPVRAVSINNGYPMRAWFDVTGFTPDAPEDGAGIAASARRVQACIAAQVATGIESNRVVLAGFSQGGAAALYAGIGHAQPLAGILGLSTWLPLRSSLATHGNPANSQVPILMCHGSADTVVPALRGRQSCELLRQGGYTVEWQEYPMQHELCAAQIAHVASWLAQRFVRPAS